jgi:hypothetical protein
VIRLIGSVLHDARIALRGLWKSRGFTTVTVLSVAIGTITAIFSVLDAMALKPLPYPDGDRRFGGHGLRFRCSFE